MTIKNFTLHGIGLYCNVANADSVTPKRIILIKRVRLRDFARLGVILPLGANFDWT